MAILEMIGRKIADAGQGAAQQAKNLTEISKWNHEIMEKEKAISQLFSTIGKTYFNMQKDNPNASLREEIDQITSLQAEIMQCQEEIKRIKGTTKCPACGADVPLRAAFCNACGARVISTASDSIRQCPVCNGHISTNDPFCTHCGSKI